MSIRGFSGTDRIPGDVHGTAHICAISHDIITPITYNVDTMQTLNHDLLSMIDFYERLNFDIQLTRDDDSFSGLIRNDADGTITRIPAHYDKIGHRWLIHYVIARTPADAKRAAETICSE